MTLHTRFIFLRNLRVGIACCAMLFVPFVAGAMTLEESLVHAYQNNPTLQAQRALVRSVDETVNQALSGWRPEIELSVIHI